MNPPGSAFRWPCDPQGCWRWHSDGWGRYERIWMEQYACHVQRSRFFHARRTVEHEWYMSYSCGSKRKGECAFVAMSTRLNTLLLLWVVVFFLTYGKFASSALEVQFACVCAYVHGRVFLLVCAVACLSCRPTGRWGGGGGGAVRMGEERQRQTYRRTDRYKCRDINIKRQIDRKHNHAFMRSFTNSDAYVLQKHYTGN